MKHLYNSQTESYEIGRGIHTSEVFLTFLQASPLGQNVSSTFSLFSDEAQVSEGRISGRI